MSKEHLESIQAMIEELEQFGTTSITELVKLYTQPYYLHLCTLTRPDSDVGSISINTVEELLTLLERVDPSRLKQQVWFCEACHVVSAIRYRKGAYYREVTQALADKHQELSPNCQRSGLGLRMINTPLIPTRAELISESTVPNWAKEQLAQLLFGEETQKDSRALEEQSRQPTESDAP